MIGNIHKWLLVRLALVWFIMSLVSGGLFHYLSHARLDEHIVKMAKAEASTYRAGFVEYVKSPSDQAFARFKQNIHSAIESDNFVAIRLCSTDSDLVAEATKPSARQIEERLSPQGNEFSSNSETIGEMLTVNGESYLRVISSGLRSGGENLIIFSLPGKDL